MALYMIYDVCSHFNSLKFSSFISNLDIRSLVLPKFSRRFHELFTAGLFAASSYVLLRMGAEEPIDKKWFKKDQRESERKTGSYVNSREDAMFTIDMSVGIKPIILVDI